MSCRLLILACVLAVSAPARADDPPWSRGVTPEHKAAAQKLLEAGNELFLANKHKEALVKYAAAVAEWDHPAIRFNMVRALIALDHVLEASDNLEKALAYGAKPLEDAVYQEALNYQKLLAHQISNVELTCTQHDVTVKLDGDTVLSCPGTTTLRRLPGRHLVVATAPRKATTTKDLVLIGGERESISVSVSDPEIVSGPRWATWKPWAVVGVGVAIAGVGFGFRVVARAHADDVERSTVQLCADGCTKDDYKSRGLAALEATANREGTIAVTGLVIGGAAVLVGGAFVALNRRYYEHATVTADARGASVGIAGRF